ncbi:MAG: hypothetical protein HY716_04250 [Planctomycetes bacterium]|nr:hypothetical protein [Planctomycetota bacterium]
MIPVLPAVLAFILAGSAAQDAKKDAKKELKEAAKKTSELKSYEFKGDVDSQAGGIRIGNRRQDDEEEKLEDFKGGYEKKVGAFVKTNVTEFATIDGKTARRKSKEEWHLASGDSLPGRCPRPPHELLNFLCSEIESAKKKEAKDKVGDVECAVYDVEFSEEGAQEILKESGASGGMRFGNAETTGDGKIWVDPDGRIVKFRASASSTLSMGGMEMNLGSATWSTTLANLDGAKVEIPEKAREVLKETEKEAQKED